jgi:aminodeoxyfutalosine synthase
MTVPTLDAVAAKLAAGTPLERADHAALASTTDLVQLGLLATEARRRRMGDEVTYVRVVEHRVGDPLPDAFPATAGEIRLIGVPSSPEAAIARAWAAVERSNGVPVTAWALADLVALTKDLEGLGTLARGLREAGIAGIADVRLDLVEDTAIQWVVDHGLGLPVVGIHAAPAHPVVFLRRVAALQRATKAFRAVAPLPRHTSAEAPSTGYDDVKLIALAALIVDGVGRVQIDWRQHGAKLSQVALLFGANDLDHVPASDDAPLGPRRAPLEEVRRNIQAASLTPVARTARFEAVTAGGPAAGPAAGPVGA